MNSTILSTSSDPFPAAERNKFKLVTNTPLFIGISMLNLIVGVLAIHGNFSLILHLKTTNRRYAQSTRSLLNYLSMAGCLYSSIVFFRCSAYHALISVAPAGSAFVSLQMDAFRCIMFNSIEFTAGYLFTFGLCTLAGYRVVCFCIPRIAGGGGSGNNGKTTVSCILIGHFVVGIGLLSAQIAMNQPVTTNVDGDGGGGSFVDYCHSFLLFGSSQRHLPYGKTAALAADPRLIILTVYVILTFLALNCMIVRDLIFRRRKAQQIPTIPSRPLINGVNSVSWGSSGVGLNQNRLSVGGGDQYVSDGSQGCGRKLSVIGGGLCSSSINNVNNGFISKPKPPGTIVAAGDIGNGGIINQQLGGLRPSPSSSMLRRWRQSRSSIRKSVSILGENIHQTAPILNTFLGFLIACILWGFGYFAAEGVQTGERLFGGIQLPILIHAAVHPRLEMSETSIFGNWTSFFRSQWERIKFAWQRHRFPMMAPTAHHDEVSDSEASSDSQRNHQEEIPPIHHRSAVDVLVDLVDREEYWKNNRSSSSSSSNKKKIKQQQQQHNSDDFETQSEPECHHQQQQQAVSSRSSKTPAGTRRIKVIDMLQERETLDASKINPTTAANTTTGGKPAITSGSGGKQAPKNGGQTAAGRGGGKEAAAASRGNLSTAPPTGDHSIVRNFNRPIPSDRRPTRTDSQLDIMLSFRPMSAVGRITALREDYGSQHSVVELVWNNEDKQLRTSFPVNCWTEDHCRTCALARKHKISRQHQHAHDHSQLSACLLQEEHRLKACSLDMLT